MVLVCLLLFSAVAHIVNGRLGLKMTQLTTANFDAFIRENDEAMIDFFNPIDKFWNDDKEQLEKALRKIQKHGKYMTSIAKVDIQKEPELGRRYVINGRYPQLIWFVHGHPTQYHKTLRKAKEIARFWLELDRAVIASVESVNEVTLSQPSIVAEIKKESPMYTVLDTVALKHMRLAVVLHIESDKGVITFRDGENATVYSGGTNVKELDQWFRNIRPVFSEPLPEGDMKIDRGSWVVVGANFADVVLQEDKDVLIYFYAPWCGYCRAFNPEWDRIAQYLSRVPHLVVAKMDVTRNQLVMDDAEWVTNASPAICFKSAGTTYLKPFQGDLNFGTIVDFVKEHTTQELALSSEGNRTGIDTDDSAFDL